MNVGELRPAEGQHGRNGIQLHGAGAERNHRLRQGKVFVLQTLDVAHHRRFRVVGVENRVPEIAERRRRATGMRSTWGVVG